MNKIGLRKIIDNKWLKKEILHCRKYLTNLINTNKYIENYKTKNQELKESKQRTIRKTQS